MCQNVFHENLFNNARILFASASEDFETYADMLYGNSSALRKIEEVANLSRRLRNNGEKNDAEVTNTPSSIKRTLRVEKSAKGCLSAYRLSLITSLL